VIDEIEVPCEAAYKELVDFRFLKKPLKCLHCSANVSNPRSYVYPGKLYVRCLAKKCEKRCNVCDYGAFKGTRMTLSELLRTVTYYCRANRSKAPLVADAGAHLRLRRWAVTNLFTTLRAAEAKAGVKFCKKAKVKGGVEGDAHGLRKFYVSSKNAHFKQEINEAMA